MMKILRWYFPDEVIRGEWNNFHENRPYPLIIFPCLGTDWTINKPEKQFHSSYLKELRLAVDWLNRSGVSHNDLLPRNVMWRAKEGGEGRGRGKGSTKEVEIKLIDFEYACNFNSLIPQPFAEAAADDCRYPFRFMDENEIRGSQEANEFFYRAIARFLQSTDSSFRDFMTKRTSTDLFKKK